MKQTLLAIFIIAFTNAFSQEPKKVTYKKDKYEFKGHWIMDYQVSKYESPRKLVGDSAQIIGQGIGLIWINGLKVRIVADSIKIYKINFK